MALLAIIAPGANARVPATEAKELFEQGKAAMNVGRFADAERLFRRSLELVPKASAAFNLAVSQRGLGKPKEAHDTLAQLLSGGHGALPGDMRAQADELARETAREVASLHLVVKGAPSAEVRIDGASAGTVSSKGELAVRVNPGERVVTITARLRDTVERRVLVASGKVRRIAVQLTLSRAARMATLVLIADSPDRTLRILGVAEGRGRLERKLEPGKYTVRVSGGGGSYDLVAELDPATERRMLLEAPRVSLLKKPWFWTAALAVAGGAVLGGYVLLHDRTDAPVRDSEFSVTQTLSRSP